eukprot:COSAG01_NODE_9794_length_2341_cov_121.184211_1_plen_164_part_00
MRSAVSPVEQQRQPLESSTTLPRPARPPSDPSRTTREISPASMFTSARSLTAAATRKLAVLERMWRSRAVLPEPRKPVTSVTGRSRGLAAHACASRWQKRLMRASSSAAADADDAFMPRLLACWAGCQQSPRARCCCCGWLAPACFDWPAQHSAQCPSSEPTD